MAPSVAHQKRLDRDLDRQLHRDIATAHAVKRAAERCPRPLTYAEITAHEADIREGRAVCIGGHAQRQLYRLTDEEATYFAVWCCQIECIVTYLASPRQWRGRLNSRAWEVC